MAAVCANPGSSCPNRLSPHAESSRSTDNARLWFSPARNLDDSFDTVRNIDLPRNRFRPQAMTLPSKVTANVWYPPASIPTTSSRSARHVPIDLRCCLPMPLPCRRFARPQLCPAPPETATASTRSSGTVSCPDELSPQATTVRSGLTARLWRYPAPDRDRLRQIGWDLSLTCIIIAPCNDNAIGQRQVVISSCRNRVDFAFLGFAWDLGKDRPDQNRCCPILR